VPARRFPPPWTAEDNGACFIVRDHKGQALAYVYYEDEPGRRSADGGAPSCRSCCAKNLIALMMRIPKPFDQHP
jgi:hypothetical protein